MTDKSAPSVDAGIGAEDRTLPGMLAGLRVVEVADELAEICGLLLAGLGAEVIKVEPPEGNSTRRIGPFHRTTRRT